MEANTVNIHADLIARCRNEDRSAQFEIYKLYNKAMFNTALRIVGDENEAEDVLQDAFVSAFQNLKSYREDASFWSMAETDRDQQGAKSGTADKKDLMLAQDIKEEVSEFEPEKTEPTYSVVQVQNAMNELPSGFRTVLSLYLFEGYDHKEIGEILGITESTSKSQYKRAKDKLKMIVTQEVNYG